MPTKEGPSRRRLLSTIGAGFIATLAGCSGNSADGSSGTPSPNTPPVSPTPRSTDTVRDSSPPRILEHHALPRDHGTTLAVRLVAEDEHGLAYAAVSYGDHTIEERLSADRITIDERIDDVEEVDHEEPGRVTFLVRDRADHETRKEVVPDDQAPELSIHAEPADTAGEVVLTLEGRDDTGLDWITAGRRGEEVMREALHGRNAVTIERTVGMDAFKPFGWNRIGSALTDWNGNRTGKTTDSYVRRYDVLEDAPLDIGIDTTSLNLGQLEKCIRDGVDTGPALTGYDTYRIPAETVTKWIDQMQGHGIGRMIIAISDGTPWEKTFAPFLESELYAAITAQPHYWVSVDQWQVVDRVREDLVYPMLDTLRSEVMAKDNAATYDGRPILTLGNVPALGNPDRRETIDEEWGGYEEFVEDWRSRLTVDGTEPFLVAGTAGFPGSYTERFRELCRPFDAVTNLITAGVWDGSGGEVDRASWEETYRFAETEFQAHRDFAERNGMEFIPRVFPGFDDRTNTCINRNRLDPRYIPRSPDHLAQLLDLVDQYRTTDMVNIATWRDFTEGTQIEPGTYRGKNYGTAYLDVVQEFQQRETG